MQRDEVRQAIAEFRAEFEKDFPDQDPLRVASQYCNVVLQSKMTALLERWFGFREPQELIVILEYIHEQTRRAAQDGKRPGRPKKPRHSNGAAVPN